MNQTNKSLKGIRGAMLSFTSDPFLTEDSACYTYLPDALIVVSEGKIVKAGEYSEVSAEFPLLKDIDVYDESLIIPGLIDTHLHYVQSPMIGSYGDTLLDWLNAYTFPTEEKFRDPDFAAETARIFFRQLLRNGTTTANVFATTFPESVDAFFTESERYGTRMISGKVLQDRNLPTALADKSAAESVEISEMLLNKWHARGRQLYAVIPRFAPTSTPEQLRLAGKLYEKYRDRGVYMHTHLDEAEDEIRWVAELFPDAANYTDVYRSFGLLGDHSIMAHCCIVKPEEWKMLYDNGCGVAHCPSSNLFLGDGEFKWWEAKTPGRALNVGIGSDIGGGTSFSIIRQLSEAYKVGMLQSRGLDAMRSFYLATRGGAETLRLADKIGSILPGYEADLCVLDLKPDEFTQWRLGFETDIFSKLFALQTLAPANCVRATYIAGRPAFVRDSENPFSYRPEI